MKISFSPPYIDDDITEQVVETLRSGWITSGPKVRDLENLCAEYVNVEKAICVNSWTSGAALVLKWFGIGPDEAVRPGVAAGRISEVNEAGHDVLIIFPSPRPICGIGSPTTGGHSRSRR